MPAFLFWGFMAIDSAITRVWEIAAPLAADEGMEIIDIELRREGRGKVLRLYMDKEGGPSLDDLARVSRQLSDLLDVRVAVEGPYTLEVSSPGVNRLLKRREHFVRFIGKKVRVRTRDMIAGRRSFLGVLKAVGESGIVLLQEGAEFHIPLSVIEKANYEHDWSGEGCSKT